MIFINNFFNFFNFVNILSIYFYLRKFLDGKDYFYSFGLLLPFISWVPLCLIFYEDTRFRIVSESLFIPASAYLIARLNSVMFDKTKFPVQKFGS